ncbi:hypothetical protein BDW62DRAFT_200851 [Aspergillus aurantiobrunneus]
MRENVAILLSTRELLNLRSVSRVMGADFHDNHFWKSRFRKDQDRGYLDWVDINQGNTDWRLLYHASSKAENRFETTVKVWEVVRWIQDALAAKKGLQAPPLEFYGRALQYYHDDSSAVRRQVERAEILPSLAKIGVTIVSDQTVYEEPDCYRLAGRIFDKTTEIVALEFISKGQGSKKITLGSRNRKAKTMSPKTLEKALKTYRRQQHSKHPAPESPFDGDGIRLLLNAKDFTGFRIGYFADGISSTEVLQRNMIDNFHSDMPPVWGLDANDYRVFDMGMEKVAEVVATFEGPQLVDLGIRGHSVGQPWHCGATKRSFYESDDDDVKQFGSKILQKQRLDCLETVVQETDGELKHYRGRMEKLTCESMRWFPGLISIYYYNQSAVF